ncbi:type I-E CRISPR-associated protein Cas7/Cse4/CasC [Exilibacterium tricleocarpae]|uniref:Type I-E CRISPR-associated protein Cas7/Cse4/CasC n=1 Tax=Exilibacterium tricleocarpae TaxID=2591008 RepID=A0A545TZ24_9GAMM|nr:type I-E CRISPR-associated protein Cas7/Cse4/CasC [Exilibacterium tricleocarpae]TQV82461.1 type I-E CRISPR-associated protein Cas7/Cse4/CasC [Exilibacterium tricleocarpae]
MTQFIQLHILTSYPPSNLNRDDLGRPKSAKMGGFDRLRISSQALKRAWRTSEIFEAGLGDHKGIRTRRLGQEVKQSLLDAGVAEGKAKDWTAQIAGVFGKVKKDSATGELEQLAHISPVELAAIRQLTAVLADEKRAPDAQELELLKKNHKAVDIALFGRMMASKPDFNMEAAAQVSHAISVHAVAIEDDFFSAVDDLNTNVEDSGAGHIGDAAFAAGLFYTYVCINKDLLLDNLEQDHELAAKALKALTEAILKVSPTGKQNSFASRAYASYVLAEKGSQQPRSLSVAYLKPIVEQDYGTVAVQRLQEQRRSFDSVYGACAEQHCELNAFTGEGSFEDVIQYVTD